MQKLLATLGVGVHTSVFVAAAPVPRSGTENSERATVATSPRARTCLVIDWPPHEYHQPSISGGGQSMTKQVRARGLVATVALSLFSVPLLGTGAAATNTEVCTPTPKVASSFCITYSVASGPTLNARDPFNADVTFANTSNSHQTDQSKWLDSLTLHLAVSNLSAPGIAPSKSLPNNLVIAGNDNDCSSPDFANCDAGHGVFVVNVTTQVDPVPFVTGNHTGTFGIRRVVNVN